MTLIALLLSGVPAVLPGLTSTTASPFVAAGIAMARMPLEPPGAGGPPVAVAKKQPMFGAFTYGGVWQGMEPVLDLEQRLGRRLDIVHWFMNWDHAFDPTLVARASAGGRLPMISWQPHHQDLADIAAGSYDAYIRSWARGLRDVGTVVYLRPFPEMNGDWVPWSGRPVVFRAAWVHMVEVFREQGATNVRWVWSPNLSDGPATPDNAMELYYPGDAYVDVLALDGYNWGTVRPWSAWRSFDDIFAAPYARVTAIGPQPVWLAELASTGKGGDKAAWVRDMLASTAFPRITALVWFNQDKETDWRIDAAADVIEAARAGLAGGDPAAAR